MAQKESEAQAARARESKELLKGMEEQAASGPGIRDFVRRSLLDIMGAVDDAAAMGRLLAYDDGLACYLPAVTAIRIPASHGESVAARRYSQAPTRRRTPARSWRSKAATGMGSCSRPPRTVVDHSTMSRMPWSA